MKKVYLITILLLITSIWLPGLCTETEFDAEDITGEFNITVEGKSVELITDKKQATFNTFGDKTDIKLEGSKEISGIYIIWEKIIGEWKLKTETETIDCGLNGFLHEYIEIPATKSCTMELSKGGKICEIYLFTSGKLPEWVQVWDPPYKRADMLLMSTHADDEHLYFAGLMPYYAVEKGIKVQVIYMTNHFDTSQRPHEQLNGLWKVGMRNYPIIGGFPDIAESKGSSKDPKEKVLADALKLYDEDKVTAFQVEQIRRFKPMVIVGHDIKGEYTHGAHMVNAYTLQKALEMSNKEEFYKESYEKYGLWDVPKTYLHLWPENKITMNWDIPLESLNGKTAFEVSKEGYKCHASQQWTMFTKWIAGENIKKASDIATYSPCEFGLYRTTVGMDVQKNDFLENITLYVEPTPTTTPEITDTPAPTLENTVSPRQSATPDDTKNNGDRDYFTVTLFVLLLVLVIFIIIIIKKIK